MSLPSQSPPILPPAFKYWCFISYRHLDNRDEHRNWATWLHQQIEHYEVPAELVGTPNDSGEPIPARIYPVFRDEDSLAADAHLGEEIREALLGSKTMLVICSPRSATSPYVESEIKYFQELGRAERIITAIIDGEPHHAERECFPAPLRLSPREGSKIDVNDGPLAADFRLPDGTQGYTSLEGYRLTLINSDLSREQAKALAEKYEARMQLMKLKILSGILDIGLEKLRNRDKAYQLALEKKRASALRRWLAMVAALAGIAVAGGAIAYLQRQEARKQESIARKEEARVRRQFYRTQIGLSSSLIKKQELAAARAVLLNTDPANRGWEWAYLLSRCGATPKAVAELQPGSKWVSPGEIEALKSSLKSTPAPETTEANLPELKRKIVSGSRQLLSDGGGRPGSYGIVYQSDPPTALFSYWLGMYSDPPENAFCPDGSVLIWSGEYGDPGGRRANVSTGDMMTESICIAPLPNRLKLPIQRVSEDEDLSPGDSLLDPRLLPFGPMTFGPSNDFVPKCEVSFEAGKNVIFSFESAKGPLRLARDLTQPPLHFKDKRSRAEAPEQALIAGLAKRNLERKFCGWFDRDGERYAILEGEGLELWRSDGSGKSSICPPGALKAGTEDGMPPSFWAHTAVQIGKTQKIAGWLQSDDGRFLGVGNIERGEVDVFLLDSDRAKIGEAGEYAYNIQTLMTSSPSGSRIYYSLLGRNEEIFQAWNGTTGELILELASGIPKGIGSDPQELFVAVLDAQGELTLREEVGGKILHRYAGIHPDTDFDIPVRRSPDGQRIMIANLVVDATTFEDLLLLEPGTRVADDWLTAVSWIDGQTAEITSMGFWDVLGGRGEGTGLFLNERLLLAEIQSRDSSRNED